MFVCLAEHCINSYRIDRVKVVLFLDFDTKLYVFISQYWKEKSLWHNFAKHLLPVNKHLKYFFEVKRYITLRELGACSGVCFSPLLAVSCSSVGDWQCSDRTAGQRALHSTVSAHSSRTGYGLPIHTQAELFPALLHCCCFVVILVSCPALFVTSLASTIVHSLLEQWLSLGAFPVGSVEQEWCSFLVGAQGSGVPTFALAAAALPSETPPVLLLGWDHGDHEELGVWNLRSSLWRLWHPQTAPSGSSA